MICDKEMITKEEHVVKLRRSPGKDFCGCPHKDDWAASERRSLVCAGCGVQFGEFWEVTETYI